MVINAYLIICPQIEETMYQSAQMRQQIDFVKKLSDKEKIYVSTEFTNTDTSVFDGAVYDLYDVHKNIEVFLVILLGYIYL